MNYFVWNTGPELVSFGNFSIAWYGLLFATGFFLGFHIMRWVFIREGKSLTSLDKIFVYMVLGAVLGARLGHCLFYDPVYYLSNPLEISQSWRLSWNVACDVYLRKTNSRYKFLLDPR